MCLYRLAFVLALLVSLAACDLSADTPTPLYVVSDLTLEAVPPRAPDGTPILIEIQTPIARSYWATETSTTADLPLSFAPRCGADSNVCNPGDPLVLPAGTYLILGSAAGTRLFAATISTPADSAALPSTQTFGGQNRWGTIQFRAP